MTLQIINESGYIEQVESEYRDIIEEIREQAKCDGNLVFTY